MAKKNALAKLAEKLNADKDIVLAFKKDLGDKEDEVGGMVISDICKASRIVAELAKMQDEEAALLLMEIITADEARRIVRQRERNCILKCRVIAEEHEVAK